MKDKVIKTTRNFTKDKGMIICNKGQQQKEVVDLLKRNNYNINIEQGKGGSVNIKYVKGVI